MKNLLKQLFAVAALLLIAGVLNADDSVLQIRKTAQKPFYANGKRVEAVWNKADTLTGLVNPQQGSVEPFRTRAQMLYDNDNLYVSLQAEFRADFRSDRTAKYSLWSDNNFEFFIQPDPAVNNYYHIAASEGNHIYTGVMRTKSDLPGIKHSVISGKEEWVLNLTIPLSTIGMTSPDGVQKIRFNICRNNIDMPKGKEYPSCAVAYDAAWPNYHVPDLWADGCFTTAEGAAKPHRPSSAKMKYNLRPDPGFNFAKQSSFTNPDVQLLETMAMSDIWFIRATGKAYNFYSIWVKDLVKPGKTYTLRVRARRYGSEGSFAAIQLGRRSDGKGYTQIGSVCWGIPFTEDFHEYYIPFKAVEGVISLPLYRLGTRNNNTGIDIENISLFEGEVSSFEVRRIDRAGVKKIVPGTGITFPKNQFGKTPEALNVLAICYNLTSLSDLYEIYSGLNVKADVLVTTANNADVYYTDGEPKAILEKIEKNQYDLYMIGGGNWNRTTAVQRIGKELAAKISGNIKKGANLWLNNRAPYFNFEALIKESAMQEAPADHYLKQGLPVEFHKRPELVWNMQQDPLRNMAVGKAGKGTVVTSDTAYYLQAFLMPQNNNAYPTEKFPWSAFNSAWCAKIMNYAANRVTGRISQIAVAGKTAKITCENLQDGSAIIWKTQDKIGVVTASGKAVVKNNSAAFDLPDGLINGHHVVVAWAVNSKGETLDYTTATFEVKNGPAIAAMEDNRLYYAGDAKADLTVTIRDFVPGLKLAWALEDFGGRILERGECDVPKRFRRIRVPLTALYTNLGVVTATLIRDGKAIDVHRLLVVAQDRDRKRLINDYTVSIWNYGGGPAYTFTKLLDRQLEKIGIRCFLLNFRNFTDLSSGMGLGGNFKGGGDTFCGWPQKNNIRAQHINTAAAHQRFADQSERVAAEERQLGTIHSVVCDEPNLVRPGATTELDEHPENIAEYRKRMEAKYGTIANWNKRMGTSYKSFAEVGPARHKEARETGKFGEFIEWRSFNVDRWCEIIKVISDGAKRGDPDHKLSLYNSFGQGVLGGNDYWKLLTRAGLDFSNEYTSMVYQGDGLMTNFDEFYRSFRPDMRVWGFTGYYFSKDKSYFQPWWFAMHRYGGFTWYGALTGMGSGSGTWLNLLDYTGAMNEDAVNLKDSLEQSKLLKGLGKVFTDYNWTKNDTAIYYSHESVQLAFLLGQETKEGELRSGSPMETLFRSRHEIRYLLENLLCQYEFLAPEQIVNGKLTDRKVLFIPGVSAMSDREVAAVKAFLAAGGTVVADFLPGTYDEVGMKRTASPFAEAKNFVVLNSKFDSKDNAQKKRILDLLVAAKATPTLRSDEVLSLTGREAMHFIDGDMHVFGILRDQTKSKDSAEQTFRFPVKGHLYDLRAGKYLGEGNSVKAAVPHGGAAVFGVYPYKVEKVTIAAPATVKGGTDLKADLAVKVSNGTAGKHVFHVEVVPPQGEVRFFMTRNLTAENGKAQLVYRMAENDPAGKWTLRLTDAMTGLSAEKTFIKE